MATIAMKLKGLHSAEGAGESQRETHPVRRMIAGFFLVVISALVTVTSASAAHMRYSIWSRDVNGGGLVRELLLRPMVHDQGNHLDPVCRSTGERDPFPHP